MKILVRLPNWLGDLVMSAAFMECLRQTYPTAQVDVIVKRGLEEIASRFSGISYVYVFDKKLHPGLRGAMRFGWDIGFKTKYDLAFALPNSFSSAAMLWRTGAQQRIGYSHELRDIFLTHAFKKPAANLPLHRAQHYVQLLEKFSDQRLNQLKVHLGEPRTARQDRILVNVNSEAESRRLPVEKAVAIINLLRQATHKELVLLGSPKEVPYVNAVYEALSVKEGILNIAGETNLNDLVELMLNSTLMLTTDSGPAHLANALGVYTIVLTGAGNELHTRPFNQANSTIIRLNQLPCEPCVRNTCKFGKPACLLQLNNELIVQAVMQAAKNKQ
ncbi:MAG TPA: glycosyltransferase family 9 protein [Phnomibacter sp.]|nr:glycosyltransferase family 9 protein [Phnomibacter sp.]